MAQVQLFQLRNKLAPNMQQARGGYGWNNMGVVVMSERHPEEEHPLRGPGEEGPPASEPPEGEEGEKEEEEKESKT